MFFIFDNIFGVTNFIWENFWGKFWNNTFLITIYNNNNLTVVIGYSIFTFTVCHSNCVFVLLILLQYKPVSYYNFYDSFLTITL